jgi:hypothetical protein
LGSASIALLDCDMTWISRSKIWDFTCIMAPLLKFQTEKFNIRIIRRNANPNKRYHSIVGIEKRFRLGEIYVLVGISGSLDY